MQNNYLLETKMINTIFKYFFIVFNCIQIYQYILNQKFLNRSKNMVHFLLSLLMSFGAYFFQKYIPDFTNIILSFIFWIIFSFKSTLPKTTLIGSIIAFSTSYGIFLMSGLILLTFFAPFYHFPINVPYFIFLFLIGITETIFIWILFHTKRFHNGLPFLYNSKFSNLGTLLCLCVFIAITYIQTHDSPQLWPYTLSTFLLVISLAALIFWWQAQLTKSYLHKLQLLELESLRKELEETTKEMEHLKKQNEELGRLIHKDNKLIPALETAVTDFLSADGDEKNKALGASLILQLKELSGNRREILDEVSAARSRHFATGIPALDTLLDYFDRRAEARKMEFTVNIAPNLATYVPSKISSEDITHLLADLLENAIIAVAPCASRKIRLQIYTYRKWFVIELSDTGIPFQENSLLQFGIQQLTTHESSGGSGIGLMDIWKLKEKYHASIHITEYRDTAPFSKRITFLLDHRNQYLIRTWRFEELRTKSRRADLCILPPGDEVSSSEKKEGRHTE